MTSPTIAEAVGPSPAPGPDITIRRTKSPSSTTMLVTPSSWPIGEAAGTRQGCIRASSPPPVRPGDAEELDPVAELGRMLDVGEADPLDALDGDRVEVDPRPEGVATSSASFCAASMPPTSKLGSASA